MSASSCWRSRFTDERGSLTLFAAVLALALLLMFGLVVDGGGQLAAQRRADNDAEQAARSAAQALDVTLLRTSGTAVLDPLAADRNARAYLAGAGYPDGAVVAVSPGTVEVRFTTEHPVAVLSILGVGSLPVHGNGHARLTQGVVTGEQP